MLCQDYKDNFQEELQLGLMIGKAQIIIGYIKVQMLILFGIFLKECGDGWNGTMVVMSYSQTKQKLVGITYQTVDLILNKTPDMENSLQSTSIITTSTLTLMKNLEPQEVLKEQVQTNTFLKANSRTNPDGDIHVATSILFKTFNLN